MKLYQRVALLMASLLVIGMLGADTVTYTSLRSFLYGRLDTQLDSAQHLAVRYLDFKDRTDRPPTEAGMDDRVGPDVYVILIGHSGKVMLTRPSGSPDRPDPEPVLPVQLRAESHPRGTFQANNRTYRAEPGSFDVKGLHRASIVYRAEALSVPQGTLVLSVSVDPTTGTLNSLLRFEAIASLIVLVAISLLALWIVRRGLRPLEHMTKTAGDIASGDLSLRVDVGTGDSEVDRLGGAFNVMVSKIEAAFFEKTLSETQFRQFVADASHELRTPLTSIRGYSELLVKGAFPTETQQQRTIRRIQREAERMGDLVDDLLLLARLDQGRPLEQHRVDLFSIFKDAVDDARASNPDRTIDLRAEGDVRIIGDQNRLVQVAHNLIGNALIHTPSDVPVRVSISSEDGFGTVKVHDTGPGIPDSQIHRVFDRFYRGDPARSGEGTGLGLSIVKAIVESSGGKAEGVSDPSEGTTFTVRIPLSDERTLPIARVQADTE